MPTANRVVTQIADQDDFVGTPPGVAQDGHALVFDAGLGGWVAKATELRQEFEMTDLTVADLLVINHSQFNKEPSSIAIYDPSGDEIEPDERTVSDTSTAINLASFRVGNPPGVFLAVLSFS